MTRPHPDTADAFEGIAPAPAPMTAEQMLRALIQTNKAEAVIAEEAFDQARAEVLRLDAIREGLENALKAIRYPKASAPTQ